MFKEETSLITIPPLSVSKVFKIYFDDDIHLIAGTIEAEDYKPGGQSIGFSDTTTEIH